MSIARLILARFTRALQAHHLRRGDPFMTRAEAGDSDALARAKVHLAKAEKWSERTKTLLREPARDTTPPTAG